MSTTAVKPPVWKMVKEAVEALGSPTTNVMVRDWILKKYPGTNKSTIGCQTIICTVNHDSRIHYPENTYWHSEHSFIWATIFVEYMARKLLSVYRIADEVNQCTFWRHFTRLATLLRAFELA